MSFRRVSLWSRAPFAALPFAALPFAALPFAALPFAALLFTTLPFASATRAAAQDHPPPADPPSADARSADPRSADARSADPRSADARSADARSADARSADDERARTHFDAGRLHYDEGAYDRALVEFQRAYELSRRSVLLLNLATVKERLGMHAEAATDLRAYLAAVPDDDARDRLERRVANLERLAAGDASEAESPAESEATPEPRTAPAVASGPDSELLGGAIASYAVGGAGLVVMGVLGGMALAEDGRLATGCGASASCSDAEVADANTFALVSDVGLGVAVTGIAVGTVLLVVALSAGGDAEPVSVLPWVSPEGAGLAAGGRF